MGNVLVTIAARPYAAVYKVYRGLAGGSRTLVHTSTSQAANAVYTWDDTGVTGGTTYDYHVIAQPTTPTTRDSVSSGVQTVVATTTTTTPIVASDTLTASVTEAVVATPFNSSGLVLWQVADDIAQADASAVSAWAAHSPVTTGFTQGTAGLQPTYRTNVLNGHAVVRFDGTDLLAGNAGLLGILNGKPGATVFVVTLDTKVSTAVRRNTVFICTPNTGVSRVRVTHNATHNAGVSSKRLDADSSTAIADTAAFDTAAHIECATVDFANTDLLLHVDGTLVASNTAFSTTGSFSATDSLYVALGAGDLAGTDSYFGDIAEVLVFDRTLDSTDRAQVTTYLQDKYLVSNTPKVASDTLTASVTETVAIQAFSTASDTLTPAVTESTSFATVAVVASDTLTTSVTDASATKATAIASDTLTPTAADTGTFATVAVTGADTLTPAITESVANKAAATANDTLTPAVTDSGTFATVAVVASDTLTAAITENAILFANQPGADSLVASVTDTGVVDISGTITKNASDTLVPQVTDTGTLAPIAIAAADTLTGALTEASAFSNISVNASDTLTASVTDTAIAAPFDISGLVLWQVADDIAQADASAVSAWSAHAPVAVGFTQATGTNQPTYRTNVANGHAAVRFDGTDDALAAASGLLGILNGKPGATVFVVGSDPKTLTGAFRESIYIATPSAGSARVRLTHNGGHQANVAARRLDADGITTITQVSAFDTGVHVECATVDFANTDLLLHVDGTLVASNTTFSTTGNFSATNSTSVTIGGADSAGSEPYNGDIFEVLVFDRALDSTERARVTSYLQDKYIIASTPIVASDTLTAAVTESVANRATVTASDTLTAAVTESTAFATIPIVVSDTLTPTVTESTAFATVAVVAADTLTANITETAIIFNDRPGADQLTAVLTDTGVVDISGLVIKAASDTLTASVTEVSAFATVAVSASDTLTPSVTDVGTFAGTPVVASDTLTASVTENAIVFANQPGSDSLVASVTDTGSVSISGADTKAASDTLTPQVTEVATFETVAVTASDTLTPALTESTAFATVSVNVSDTLTPTVTDTGVFSTVTVTASDTLTAQIADASIVFVNRPGADSLVPTLTDTGSVVASGTTSINASDTLTAAVVDTSALGTIAISASDTLTAQVTETRAFGTVAVTASDTLTPTVTESTAFAIVAVVASDTLTPTVTESAITFLDRPGADSLVASVTETANVQASGTTTLNASDTLTASVADIAQTVVTRTATDTLTASLTESTAFAPVAVAAADTLTVQVTDSGVFSTVTVVASDTLTPAVTDSGLTFVNRPGADQLQPILTETSSVEIGGSVTKAASDTLTATLVDTASLIRPIAVSDTLTVQVTDTGVAGVTGTIAVNASDTLTGVLTETIFIGMSDFLIGIKRFASSTKGATIISGELLRIKEVRTSHERA